MDTSDYLTVRQAADVCGISARTLHYWIQNGKLPHIIASKRKRGKLIRLSDIEALTEVTADEGRDRSAEGALAHPLRDDDAAGGDESGHALRLRNVNSSTALIAHLETLYRETIASKDETITELRRRAEAAEDEVARLREAAPEGQRAQKMRFRWQFWRT